MLTTEPTGPTEPADPARPGPAATGGRVLLIVLLAGAVLAAALALVDVVRPDGPPDPPPGSWTLVPHRGLGAWVDVYDWTVALGGDTPAVGPEDVDEMAAGVQTLYLQTSSRRSADVVMERERLEELIDRAHAHDLHVVAWYLPGLVDLEDDLERLTAAADLRVDGLGVDIEATDVADVAERNRRLLELSQRLRAEVGADRTLAAITLSSVHLGVVNPGFWPDYPWVDLAGTYDVILPMAYWTLRRGDLRDGGRYITGNLERIRALVGPDVPLHPIGGIADDATDDDLEGLVDAVEAEGAIGASLYDWATSRPEQWLVLERLRALRDDG